MVSQNTTVIFEEAEYENTLIPYISPHFILNTTGMSQLKKEYIDSIHNGMTSFK
jgi:hypothetical protein